MSDTSRQSPEEKRLRALFARAGVAVNEAGFSGYPAVGNAFGGIIGEDGTCHVVASRDFTWGALARLAGSISETGEALIIFPEPFMKVMGDQAARWVINGYQAATVSREQVIEHAVCVVKRQAVVFVDWSPLGDGALVVPRSAAEMIIYGNETS